MAAALAPAWHDSRPDGREQTCGAASISALTCSSVSDLTFCPRGRECSIAKLRTSGVDNGLLIHDECADLPRKPTRHSIIDARKRTE